MVAKVNMRIRNQEEEFEKIWQKNKAKCLRTAQENPIVISLVCEVDTSLYDIFKEIANELEDICEGMYLYRNRNLHITLIGFGLYQNVLPNLQKIIAICNDEISKSRSFEIIFRGLNLFPDTIIVQVFDPTGKLSSLVHNINKQLLNGRIITKENIGLHNRIWWVTIARFISNKVNINDLLQFLESKRRSYFGKMKVNELKIVKTDKFYSLKATEVIERFKVSDS